MYVYLTSRFFVWNIDYRLNFSWWNLSLTFLIFLSFFMIIILERKICDCQEKEWKKNWFLYRIMIRNEVSLIGDETKLKIILLFSDFIHLSFWNQGDAVTERDKLIFYTVLFQYSSNYPNDRKLTFKRTFLKYLVRKQLRKLQSIGMLMSYFYN